jgi:esterase/lipase
MFAGYTDFDLYCQQAFSLPFTNYITFCEHHIQQVRQQAGVAHDAQTIAMNAPFEYRPEKYDGKRAVLLIHGFLTCPYIMRSIGQVYLQQGFLVRSILLPGHGTVPGELKNVDLEYWQQAVEYGIESLKRETKEIHLCGYSLGATLACLSTQRHTITSLTLLSPAFGITRSAYLLPFTSKVNLEMMQWVCKLQEDDLATYRSISAHGAWQVLRAIRLLTPHLLQIQLPCFVAASCEDSTVKIKPILRFFKNNKNTRSHLRLYCKIQKKPTDTRMESVHSSLLEKYVLDISHIAIPVAPEDAYYGRNGKQKGTLPEKYVLGEKNKYNLRQPNFYRLSYNPDFAAMAEKLKAFL